VSLASPQPITKDDPPELSGMGPWDIEFIREGAPDVVSVRISPLVVPPRVRLLPFSPEKNQRRLLLLVDATDSGVD